MFVAFSAIAISAGAPPMLTLLMIAFTSNLCMSLTHYAAGPSPVIFNTGYVPQNTWWKLGFFSSVINLIIFCRIRFYLDESNWYVVKHNYINVYDYVYMTPSLVGRRFLCYNDNRLCILHNNLHVIIK